MAITSTGGNVNISATWTTSSKPAAIAVGYIAGNAGVAAALGFDNATVQSLLNGHITAAGSITGGGTTQTSVFDGGSSSAVNLLNSTLSCRTTASPPVSA